MRGGNDRIARGLTAGLGGAVRLSAPVARVLWRDGGVTVSGDGWEAVADAAVIAVPASVVDAIGFDPPLPPGKGRSVTARSRSCSLL